MVLFFDWRGDYLDKETEEWKQSPLIGKGNHYYMYYIVPDNGYIRLTADDYLPYLSKVPKYVYVLAGIIRGDGTEFIYEGVSHPFTCTTQRMQGVLVYTRE